LSPKGTKSVLSPKLHFLDSGLLATARGLTFDRIKADRGIFSGLLKSFVFAEVLKLMDASDLRLTPYHFRDQQMHEVDIVLERDDGMIVGIEIKAPGTRHRNDRWHQYQRAKTHPQFGSHIYVDSR